MNADGNSAYAEAMLINAMAEAPPDLVVTVATLASLAAREILSGTTIPQLFMIVTDPVSTGFVDAMNTTSNSNITGQTNVVPAELQMEMVSKFYRQLNVAGRSELESTIYISCLNQRGVKAANCAATDIGNRRSWFSPGAGRKR